MLMCLFFVPLRHHNLYVQLPAYKQPGLLVRCGRQDQHSLYDNRNRLLCPVSDHDPSQNPAIYPALCCAPTLLSVMVPVMIHTGQHMLSLCAALVLISLFSLLGARFVFTEGFCTMKAWVCKRRITIKIRTPVREFGFKL